MLPSCIDVLFQLCKEILQLKWMGVSEMKYKFEYAILILRLSTAQICLWSVAGMGSAENK